MIRYYGVTARMTSSHGLNYYYVEEGHFPTRLMVFLLEWRRRTYTIRSGGPWSRVVAIDHRLTSMNPGSERDLLSLL